MEAERSGGGPNQSPAGRNPNGPKAVLGPSAAAAGAMAGSSQSREPQDGDAGLSLPGILHFIQYEWSRFQAEKYRWEAERDELRVNALCFGGSIVLSVLKMSCFDALGEVFIMYLIQRYSVLLLNVPAHSMSKQWRKRRFHTGVYCTKT